MSIATLVTGDDSTFPVQLTKDEQTFLINPGATIQASVISSDRQTVLLLPVAVVEATPGSDWVQSLVVAVFDSASTAVIPSTYYNKTVWLEIQVDDGGKLTWFDKVKVLKGTIA